MKIDIDIPKVKLQPLSVAFSMFLSKSIANFPSKLDEKVDRNDVTLARHL
jgi:hypothetical protein